MRLLVRTTVIALFLTVMSVFELTLFSTHVMRVSVPPQEFSAWPTAKKEAWLYEHHHPALQGFELAKTWLRSPSEALPYITGEATFAFVLSWFASLLGSLWATRGRHNCSFQRKLNR